MNRPSLKTCRRTGQIVVALAFVLIPFLNHLRINVLYGNFLSFQAGGLPLTDPLAVLQVALKNWPVPGDLLIAAGIALALALCLGTVFCSWICPFGLLSEGVFELGRWILPHKYGGCATRGNGFLLRAGIFGLGLLAVAFFPPSPVLNQLSLPGWYSRIFQMWFIQKHASLALGFITVVLLGEFCARHRLWCRYACPQTILMVAAKLVNPYRLRVEFNRDKCLCTKAPDPCQAACSLSLNPKTFKKLETECNNCGDCVVKCKGIGRALGLRFAPMVRRSGLPEESRN